MRYQLRTFKDIVDAICEQLKIQASDTVSRNRVKRNINLIYLDEVVTFKNWPWLRVSRTLQTEAYVSAGTASVTQNSVAVTLTTAPVTSKAGFYFSSNDSTEIYRITSHTAGSTTIALETPYTGATKSAASYKIWSDAVPLPADCKETIEISHQYNNQPLENYGLQEYRRITATGPKSEGRPKCYTTTDYEDPEPYSSVSGLPSPISRTSAGLVKSITFASSISAYLKPGDSIRVRGAGNYSYNIEATVSAVSSTLLTYTGTVSVEESDVADTAILVEKRNVESYESYRKLLVYPYLSDKRTTLHVDYLKLVEPLENDTDEPIIPISNRIVLYYGGMWLSAERERNPEWAQSNYTLFQAHLARMAGKTEDSPDMPVLRPSRNYMASKRLSPRRRGVGGSGSLNFGSQGGGSVVTGTASTVAIFNDQGEIQGSATISTDELAYLNGTESGSASLLDNQSSPVQIDAWSATTYKHAHIIYGINRGASYESGTMHISTDGSNTAYAVAAAASSGATGVVLSADISGGNIRLLYTTTSTGAAATFIYKIVLL